MILTRLSPSFIKGNVSIIAKQQLLSSIATTIDTLPYICMSIDNDNKDLV